eukprot:TRINITY_DN569_c0_g1_i1.p1 TRINITY_DN569_c0_g1~~TRINITY_DN569_c0_g1_i1.p1  ORF type:complete len:1331 (-),score=369.49 TRINITY_DN569_c0_g1_i1:39-4031(-)
MSLHFTRPEVYELVQRSFPPRVLVVATPEAEAFCKCNGLSAVELFEPYNYPSQRLVARTLSDEGSPHSLTNFFVEYITLRELRECPIPEVIQVTGSLMKQKREGDLYYPDYRILFNSLCRASNMDTLKHPVAVIAVATTSEDDYIDKLRALFIRDRCAEEIKEIGGEMMIFKHHVLLVNEEAEAKKMEDLHGKPPTEEDMTKKWSIWNRQVFGAFAEGGSLLRIQNADAVKGICDHVMSRGIVPFMTTTISMIARRLQQTKKGFKNRLSSWWKSSSGTEKMPRAFFENSSIEMQQRRLADYLFFLQDYDAALVAYKSAGTDFKSERGWLHYAACQEMMALCSFITGGPRTQVEHLFESALKNYRRMTVSTPHHHRIIRMLSLLSHILMAEEMWHRVADTFIFVSNLGTEGEDCHVAVYLEQAAHAFLNLGRRRKSALHLVLAGFRFQQAHLPQHAFRCHKAALSVFSGCEWHSVDDQLNLSVARLCTELGGHEKEAVERFHFFLRSLDGKREETQRMYWKEFEHVFAVASSSPNHPNLELSPCVLPIPDENSVCVQCINDADYSYERYDLDVFEHLGRNLTRRIKKYIEGQHIVRKQKETVQFEPVTLCVDIRNPFKWEWVLEDVVPLVSIEMKPIHSMPDLREMESMKKISSDSSHITLNPARVVLRGEQTVHMELTFVPRKTGPLVVRGLRWKLNGMLAGVHRFKHEIHLRVVPTMPRLDFRFIPDDPKDSLYHGEITGGELEVVNSGTSAAFSLFMQLSHPAFFVFGHDVASVKFDDETETEIEDVTTSDMEAEESSEGMDEHESDGVEESLKLHKRTSEGGAFSLDMKKKVYWSGEDVSAFRGQSQRPELQGGSVEVAQEPPPEPERDGDGSGAKTPTLAVRVGDPSIVKLPVERLEPKEKVRIRLHVRAASIGLHKCYFLLFSEDEKQSGRIRRLLIPIHVVHALTTQISLFPHYSYTGEFIARLSFRNETEKRTIVVRNIRAISRLWQMGSLKVNDPNVAMHMPWSSGCETREDGMPCLIVHPADSVTLYARVCMSDCDHQMCERRRADVIEAPVCVSSLTLRCGAEGDGHAQVDEYGNGADEDRMHGEDSGWDPLAFPHSDFFVMGCAGPELSHHLLSHIRSSGSSSLSRTSTDHVMPAFQSKQMRRRGRSMSVVGRMEDIMLDGVLLYQRLHSSSLNFSIQWGFDRTGDESAVSCVSLLYDTPFDLGKAPTDPKPIHVAIRVVDSVSFRDGGEIPVVVEVSHNLRDTVQTLDVELVQPFDGVCIFLWEGIRRKTFTGLPAFSVRRWATKARVMGPGTYDLARVRVTCNGSEIVPQHPCLVFV